MKIKTISKTSLIGIHLLIVLILTMNAQNIHKGKNEKAVNYGMQSWTAANLNLDRFRNGDIIPQASTPEEWINAGKSGNPAWCYYENDPANGQTYGRLYNWFAINDKRGLAPEGWHIPSNSDWSTLIKNLKGIDIAGTRLKSKEGWKSRKGSDDIGFAAIPAGYRDPDGKFKDLGVVGQWWSNSAPVEVRPSKQIYSVMLSGNSIEVKYIKSDKGAGYSVRCEKD